MARGKRRRNKVQPTQLNLCYVLANGVNYIDLAKDLSVMNRRLYRQGMNYAVANMQIFFDAAGLKDYLSRTITCRIATAPNIWVVHNAWKKGFHAWNGQQKDALKALAGGASGLSARPKYADFKIGLDAAHIQLDSGSGDQDISLDVRGGDFSSTATPDEWKIASLFWEDDGGVDRSPIIHLLGQVASTQVDYVGLVENYGDSRVQPSLSDPSLPADASDSIYARMHSTEDLSDAIIDNIEGDNDQAPYDVDSYVGGAALSVYPMPVTQMAMNLANPTANSGGFIAPCGLLKIDMDNWDDPDANADTDFQDTGQGGAKCIITLVPGPYRGVMAQKMGQ